MKLRFLATIFVFLFITSCQDNEKLRALEQEKETQKREVIFANINKGWNFNSQPSNETARSLTTYWAEWRVFLNELGQKPKSSIGAFQQKAKTLSKRAAELNNNIPIKYNLPEIRGRIAVIATKVNAINLYIHLNQIPDKKIVQLVQEINTELASLNAQFDEIKVKSEIRMEDGEEDMIRMLDTARAIPTNPEPKKIK
ncbi:MAG TPA: hypothetical protein PKN96_07675 [Flavobacterium sp.]|uniref:hypothetical protein n=1 Tax=Flavobacterium sp. TaxID=239 RepID=UPI002C3C17BE|nr:hypothetical protein [Flavobacterium sp.]HNP33156.1 hypothetical protein [Flavobacterium sp.]